MTPLSNDELTGFMRYVRMLPDTDAECTTGPGIYYNGKYVFPTTGSDEDLRPVIAWLAETQPPVDSAKFSRISNRVRSLYNRARSTLQNQVLGMTGNPSSDAKYDVINDMGEALNLQLDSNPVVFQKTSDITVKLRNVGLEAAEASLYGTYVGLNKYYNATKHRSDAKFLAARSEINSLDGRLITAKYYDAVRRILVWYFARYFGITAEPELSSPNYSFYGITV
jgi:hypothetical protein